MAETRKKKSFEASVQRLEEIVSLLERGDVPLEDALKLFEEGTKLVKECAGLLDTAEQKVKLLISGGEEPKVEDFEA